MPGRNGTGPMGTGPRGRGGCTGAGYGSGRGLGMGQGGQGACMGGGRGGRVSRNAAGTTAAPENRTSQSAEQAAKLSQSTEESQQAE